MTEPASLGGKFAAPEQVALNLVEQRLADVEQQIEALSPVMGQIYLREVAGTPEPDDADTLARHRDLTEQHGRLRGALAAAQQNEANRRAANDYKADKSRIAALSQAAGKVRRSAEKLESALTAAKSAFVDLCDGSRQVHALLPPALRNEVGHLFAPRYLASLARGEMARQDDGSSEKWLDHADWANRLRRGHTQFAATPLGRFVAEEMDNLKLRQQQFAVQDPAEPAPPVAEKPVSPIGKPRPTPVDQIMEANSARQPAQPGRELKKGYQPPVDTAINLSSVPFAPREVA